MTHRRAAARPSAPAPPGRRGAGVSPRRPRARSPPRRTATLPAGGRPPRGTVARSGSVPTAVGHRGPGPPLRQGCRRSRPAARRHVPAPPSTGLARRGRCRGPGPAHRWRTGSSPGAASTRAGWPPRSPVGRRSARAALRSARARPRRATRPTGPRPAYPRRSPRRRGQGGRFAGPRGRRRRAGVRPPRGPSQWCQTPSCRATRGESPPDLKRCTSSPRSASPRAAESSSITQTRRLARAATGSR